VLVAVALQLLGLSTAVGVAFVLVLRGRAHGVPVVGWLGRLVVAALTAVVVFLIPFGAFACTCGPGNNPVRQTIIPAVAAFVVALLVDTTRKRLVAVGVLLVCAFGLAAHFSALVVPRDMTTCRFTGDPAFVRNSCARSASAARVWYTPLTGLYPLR
jgi:hypothetical protein